MLKQTTDLLTTKIIDAYSPVKFREYGHLLIDLLADYLEGAINGKVEQVLPYIEPEIQLKKWPLNNASQNPIEIFKKVLEGSIHLHHPHYVGHQNPGTLPLAALGDLVDSLLNNPSALYEMGPVSTAMEQNVIDWMIQKIGFSKSAGGFLTSGGTLGNLTALLTARQNKLKANANLDISNLAIIASEQAHYSISRAAHVMGLKKESIISLPLDNNFKFCQKELENAYNFAKSNGLTVFVAVGNACSTPTGTYDPLIVLGDFCKKHNIWFHVDGVHGASALLSNKYKKLLSGIEHADSVVWDAHKTLLMPGLVTSLIFREGQLAYETFNPKASYLFKENAPMEWFNLGRRTFECTKKMIALKVYIVLSTYGEEFFSDYIEKVYGLAIEFAKEIQSSNDFELACKPESNIVCFRYILENANNIDKLQSEIREAIIKEGLFYFTQTQLPKGTFLRCTLMNPFTTIKHLKHLLDKIRSTYKTSQKEEPD